MHKSDLLYKNPDKLLSHCINHPGKNVIKGSEILTYIKSPFAFYCNHFIDDSKKDPPNEDIIYQAEKGIIHEDQIVEEEKQSILESLGIEDEDQITEEYRKIVPTNFKIIKIPTMRDGFKICLDKMINEKNNVLHNAPLLYLPDNILGKPDTLEKRRGKSLFGSHYYVIKEIKSAKYIQKHHKFQAAFYNLLIGKIQHRIPREFYIIDGNNVETSYRYSEYAFFLNYCLSRMMDILQRKLIPPPLYNNVPYPWSEYGNELAIKNGGPTLIIGIKGKTANKLKKYGFNTINDVASCNVQKLADVPRIGMEKALKFKANAKAIRDKKIIKKEAPILYDKKMEIFLDFEGEVHIEQRIYLIGMLIREKGKKNQYISFFGKTSEKKIWREFIKFMKEQKNYIIYHWHNYEKTHIKRMQKKHKTSNEVINPIFDNMVDLYKVTTDAFAFPTFKNDLKSIANKIGFYWKDPGINGSNVGMFYRRYIENPNLNKQCLQQILDYNKNDCEATMVIKDWLVKH